MKIAYENVQKWTIIPYKWENVSLRIRILVEKWLQYKSRCHKVWWAYSIFSLLFYFVWPCYFELVDEVGSGGHSWGDSFGAGPWYCVNSTHSWLTFQGREEDEWLVAQDVLQGTTML